jgi:dTDP-4-dehydrorhamnose 3,5-epimerase
MIKSVTITPLKVFSDKRGEVKHMMKCTDPAFSKFGEIYFSIVLPRKVKAWHRNKKTTVNYAVVEGNIKLVLYDGKKMKEIFMGEDNYCLVTIPPGIWRGFQAIGNKKAIVADLMDRPYDPEDAEKKEPNELIDCWGQG